MNKNNLTESSLDEYHEETDPHLESATVVIFTQMVYYAIFDL